MKVELRDSDSDARCMFRDGLFLERERGEMDLLQQLFQVGSHPLCQIGR